MFENICTLKDKQKDTYVFNAQEIFSTCTNSNQNHLPLGQKVVQDKESNLFLQNQAQTIFLEINKLK